MDIWLAYRYSTSYRRVALHKCLFDV
jgi:hypothetical protein